MDAWLHACMVSDGSGLHARRVLKHRPVLAPVLIADLRLGPFTNSMSIPPNIDNNTTRLPSQTHVPRPWSPS